MGRQVTLGPGPSAAAAPEADVGRDVWSRAGVGLSERAPPQAILRGSAWGLSAACLRLWIPSPATTWPGAPPHPGLGESPGREGVHLGQPAWSAGGRGWEGTAQQRETATLWVCKARPCSLLSKVSCPPLSPKPQGAHWEPRKHSTAAGHCRGTGAVAPQGGSLLVQTVVKSI